MLNKQGTIIKLENMGRTGSRHSILRLESLKNLGSLGSLSRQNSRRRISIAGFKDDGYNTGRDRENSVMTENGTEGGESNADSTADSTTESVEAYSSREIPEEYDELEEAQELDRQKENHFIELPEKPIARDASAPSLPPVPPPLTSDIKLYAPIESFISSSLKCIYPYDANRQPMDHTMLYSDEETQTMIFGIISGHGEYGHELAEFTAKTILTSLLTEESWPYNLPQCLKSVFNNIESKIYDNCDINLDFTGVCFTFCLFRRKLLYVVHLGDNRAIVVTGNVFDRNIFQLTQDHLPENIEEKARIITYGGVIECPEYPDKSIQSIPRLYIKSDLKIPGLYVSRSIGDNIAHTIGVIGTPDLSQQVLSDHDKFVVICSSGVWRTLTNETIREVVAKSETTRECSEILLQLLEAYDREGNALPDMSFILLELEMKKK